MLGKQIPKAYESRMSRISPKFITNRISYSVKAIYYLIYQHHLRVNVCPLTNTISVNFTCPHLHKTQLNHDILSYFVIFMWQLKYSYSIKFQLKYCCVKDQLVHNFLITYRETVYTLILYYSYNEGLTFSKYNMINCYKDFP